MKQQNNVIKNTDEKEIMIFGQTVRSMIEEKSKLYSDIAWATSILSDAQEAISRNDLETARKFINKAKFFMNEGGK